ncbi:hypothetical protein IFM89_026981 [Coptis chinensis]|uniref:Cation/H(+) antiporter C-terminal domain-containing protein n=1 Tax=Coptis chinensis TaxID=261450 RepID=A0A835H8Q0_9MAGN|nr:hypothetical protein IFM89_026981 [Coptis chinensis]
MDNQVLLLPRPKRHSTASHICVLFLGGADDREALAYAKRMSYNIDVYITVVRLLVSEEKDLSSWEGMLDAEVVKDFELHTMSNRRITYKEEVVRDGEQTAWVIHSIIQKNDLIVVGRRNGIDSPLTSGLTEWSECPELGVIGDMLASSDVKVGVSVLVIQQMGGQ